MPLGWRALRQGSPTRARDGEPYARGSNFLQPKAHGRTWRQRRGRARCRRRGSWRAPAPAAAAAAAAAATPLRCPRTAPPNGLPSPPSSNAAARPQGGPLLPARPRQGRAFGCADFRSGAVVPGARSRPGAGPREEPRPAVSGPENGRAGGRLMKARYARCPPRSIGGSAALPGAGAPPAPAAAWTLLRSARTAAPGPPTRPWPRASYPPPPGDGPVAVRRLRFQRVLGVLVPEACCL